MESSSEAVTARHTCCLVADHSDMMRGFRYFENDLVAVTHFVDTQAAMDGIRLLYRATREGPLRRENWQYVRVPVEADVEYRSSMQPFCLAIDRR